MFFDKTEFDNMDTLLDRLLNAPDSIYLIGEGMASMHGQDCREAQALYYLSDSLRKDLRQLQRYLYDGKKAGSLCENTVS